MKPICSLRFAPLAALLFSLNVGAATAEPDLDTAGKKHTLQRKDIAEMNASALSIMSAGFDQPHPTTSLPLWNTW